MSGPWPRWDPMVQAADGGLELGRGALRAGSFTQSGSLVIAEFFIRLGAEPTPGRGHFLLVPPVPPRRIDEIPRRVGSGQVADHSDGVRHLQVAITANAVIDDHRFLFSTDGRPSSGRLIVGHDWPWTWAQDDFLVGQLAYEAV